ncbi:MAG: NUDIX domain-containing protein [Pseudomonadota bacterium]
MGNRGLLLRLGLGTASRLRGINHRLIGALGGRTVGVRMVVWRRGQVCLIRQSYGDRRAWMVPGGAVDWRETPMAAAMRETAEEVGISDLTGVRLIEAYRHRLNWGEDVVIVYAAETEAEAHCASPEIAEVTWADPAALPGATTERTRHLVAASMV